MLGTTREAIAAEKLAVVQPGAVVVLGEPEWEALARENGAGQVVVAGDSNLALGHSCRGGVPRAARSMATSTCSSRAVSSGSARIRSRSGTAPTTSPGSAMPCHGCRAPATSSSPRSSPTRTSTGCSRLSPSSGTGSWPPPRATTGPCRRQIWPVEQKPFFTHVETDRGTGRCACARPRPRRAGPRHGVPLPLGRSGQG